MVILTYMENTHVRHMQPRVIDVNPNTNSDLAEMGLGQADSQDNGKHPQEAQLSILTGSPLRYPDDYPATLTDALVKAAAGDNMIVFIGAKGEEYEISYSDLLDKSLNVLGRLQSKGCSAGRFVILQLDELQEFIITFWACVLGGMIPVPVLPFRNANMEDSSFRKLKKISSQLGDPVILMSERNAEAIRREIPQNDDDRPLQNHFIGVYTEISDGESKGIIHKSTPQDLAFLQFTSGSTSFPKGVQITHENVLTTIYGMMARLEVTETSRLLNWMPFYHDMGLIAGHLMAVVGKCKIISMKPFTFVRRPLLWLEKIHQHRVSITFSPNFGLKRILEKAEPEKLSHLDLSCLKVILNGAEPISVKTSANFLKLLNKFCNLPIESLTPGYGLAEAGLAVSIVPPHEVFRRHVLDRDHLGYGESIKYLEIDDIKASLLADEGPVVDGMNLRIVNDNDDILPVGTVGHVQIKGPSVTRGYFSNDEANHKAFCGDWFRTSDLGFISKDRFTITGRIKDIVFVNGQNYYSHDFEHACDDIDGLEGLVVIGHYDDARSEQEIMAFVACSKEASGAREKTEIIRNVQKRINQCFDVTPTLFVLLKSTGEIPKTTSGKIMRHKLLDHYLEGRFSDQCIRLIELLDIAPDLSSNPDSGRYATIDELKILIRHCWSKVLGLSTNAIGDHDQFFSLGGTSIKAIEVLALAEETVDCVISHDMFKEHDTIHRLANYIAHENLPIKSKIKDIVQLKYQAKTPHKEQEAITSASNIADIDAGSAVREDDIAIIGMGCIFPQAGNIEQFWDVLSTGRDCVTEVPNDRYNIHRFYDEAGGEINQTVSKWGSFIDSHYFDPKFFNLTENEAIDMDPHQRAFLSVAWQALQDSGLINIKGSRMGVFLGASGTGFYHPREYARMMPTTLTGTLVNLAAARVSNALNLQGPSLTVDTACSSSLVSVDLACKSILLGESDTAIAGGVQIIESVGIYLMFSKAGILSPDGKCNTFSKNANGFVPGEGAGAVVLKRYRQAINDGDRVYAVIKASAINNDGSSLGIMSPNPEGQENVIKAALKKAGIDPAEIGYVEAHGTGTHIGDLIEMRSLSLAFNSNGVLEKQNCAIGSVKTNMGHQLAAAGIAGLIKAALSIYNKKIPPSLNCEPERPELKIEESPFFVCRKLIPWPKEGSRRYAAVNSFGFGGTNAHVILGDSYYRKNCSLDDSTIDEPFVVCLSAKSDLSLDVARSDFVEFAGKPSSASLCNVAYTYNARRPHYRENRIAIMAHNMAEAALLAGGNKVEGGAYIENKNMSRTRRRMAWLFSGQGSQHPAMGDMLFSREPVFRHTVNVCDEIARPLLGISLRELLVTSESRDQIDATSVTQPLVFVMDYALASLWRSWDIRPDFMSGHSIGEYVAACLAGVFDLENALKIVIKRGALMNSLPSGGGMTAVLLPSKEIADHISELGLPLDIAAYNGPMSTVVSGELSALKELHVYLDKLAAAYSILKVSHAFHSRHTDAMLPEFKKYLAKVAMHELSIPIVSNVSGMISSSGQINTPDYWVEHIRRPVQFHKGIQALEAAGASIFLEVGAQMHLTGFVKRIVSKSSAIVASLPKAGSGISAKHQMGLAKATLYANGIDINWQRYFSARVDNHTIDSDKSTQGVFERYTPRMVSVPTYPLERRSMFRVVGSNAYPFRHIFKCIGDNKYQYIPDPDSVLFRDHVIMRTPILSGAGQCDLVSYLHDTSFGHPPKSLRKLSFHQPWLGKSKLTVSFEEGAEKEFSVVDERGRAVFKGFTDTNTCCAVPQSISIQDIEKRLPSTYTANMLYELFVKCGIEYGPFHSRIEYVRASEREALARLRPASGDSSSWPSGYYLHPGILDSAFQATAGLLMNTLRTESGNEEFPAVMTIGVESIHIFKFLQESHYYSHVTFDEEMSGNTDKNIITCNITIYEANGSPCVQINRLQLKRILTSKGQAKRANHDAAIEADRGSASTGNYHSMWRERPAPDIPISHESSRWLIFGSLTEIERQLGAELNKYGIDSILVPFEHYRHADTASIQAIFDSAGTVDGLLLLGDYDDLQDDEALSGMAYLKSLFHIFKAITAHSRKNKAYQKVSILRVTRGAYRTPESDDLAIQKSLATGFLRTARIEFPLMNVRQIDLGNTNVSDIPACLISEFSSSSDHEKYGPEILYNHGQRYALMVEPVNVERKYDRGEVFNRDKTFWIIGGTSGVGQALARHLAVNYQASIVLSGSRSLPEPSDYDQYISEHNDNVASTINFIREIEGLGSKVAYVRTDVRSAESIAHGLEIIRSKFGKLDGIYFSALQLSDKLILLKDWESYINMVDLRVNGLNELIRQTAKDDIDFIVLFSSLAGITGNVGQSDYSATNVYMDNIPYAKSVSRGCRVISVQWGPWALGQQVSDFLLENMRRNGFEQISAPQGMEALERIILGNLKNVAFVPGSSDAWHIAANINALRHGLSAKANFGKAARPVNTEESAMANSAENIPVIANDGSLHILTGEFERQRGLLMQLFENQNALLSTLMRGISPAVPGKAVQPTSVAPASFPVSPPVSPPVSSPVSSELPCEPVTSVFDALNDIKSDNLKIVSTDSESGLASKNTITDDKASPGGHAISSEAGIFEFVRSLMSNAVQMPEIDIDADQNFMELGADSMTAMSMVKEIEQRYGIELPATLLFEYSTLNELVDFLKTEIDTGN